MTEQYYTINCLTAIRSLGEILTEDCRAGSKYYKSLLQCERDDLHKAASILMRQWTIMEGGESCKALTQ